MSTETRPVLAAIWMTGAVVSFTLMAVAGRELAGQHDTFEILFYRSLLSILIVIGVGAWAGTLSQIRTERLGLHGLRNVLHFSGQNLWFYAVTVLPLAQVFALEFTTPIWVALLAPIFIRERMTATRLGAACLGFLGILIVARPDAMSLSWGVIAGAACAIGFAGTYLVTKHLSRFESTTSILFWLAVIQALLGAVTAGFDGQIRLPTAESFPCLALVGCCGLFSHFCITTALSHAPASIVAPFDFLRLPLVAVVAMFLYDEPLLASVFIGGGLVLAANLINIRAERARAATAT